MKNPCLVIIDVQEKLFPIMSEKPPYFVEKFDYFNKRFSVI